MQTVFRSPTQKTPLWPGNCAPAGSFLGNCRRTLELPGSVSYLGGRYGSREARRAQFLVGLVLFWKGGAVFRQIRSVIHMRRS